MLYQLHWQYDDGRTELKSQALIDSHEKMVAWVKNTQKNNPIPKDAIWMQCDEKSEYFVMAVESSI